MRNTDATIAWQPDRPSGRSAASLEPVFRDLRPMTLICPARPHGAPQIVSAGSVQRTIDEMVPSMFPQWQPGIQFELRGFMLRHEVSAEEMGIIPAVAA